MNYSEFLQKAKDIVEIEFLQYKQVIPKMILSEKNIFDFMEARQFQKQANGLVIIDFAIASHQLGNNELFKDYIALIMKNLRKQRQHYIYACEAMVCKGTSSVELKAYFNKHGTLANHPDRMDCMMLNYYDGENIGLIMNDIVNPETDRALLTKWWEPDAEHKGSKSGRFTDKND